MGKVLFEKKHFLDKKVPLENFYYLLEKLLFEKVLFANISYLLEKVAFKKKYLLRYFKTKYFKSTFVHFEKNIFNSF